MVVINRKEFANERHLGAKTRKTFPHTNTTQTDPSQQFDTHIFVLGPRRLQNQLLCAFIKSETGVECTSARNAYKLSRITGLKTGKTILIVDCEGRASASYLNRLQDQFPNSLTCLYNTGENDEWAAQLTKKIHGLFHEEDSIDHLIMGIHAVISGRLWLPSKIFENQIISQKGSLPDNPTPSLTRKETEVLMMVSKGASNLQIANELGITQNTVKGHLYQVYKKLKVSNRVQASLWASDHLPSEGSALDVQQNPQNQSIWKNL